MFRRERHQVNADLGYIEIWCPDCRDNTVHDLTVVTDNQVIKTSSRVTGFGYTDANVVAELEAECVECEGARRVLYA